MTAIVAIIDKDMIYMGGDSAGVSDLSIVVRKDPKVFKNGDFVFGFTSSFRMGQLLRYSFKPPKHPKNMGIDRYMNTLFIDAVRECLTEGGFAKTGYGESESGGTFLVGYKGKLFNIEDDFQVGIPAYNYFSVGCGVDLCLGSLYTTEGSGMNPRERIRTALLAAETFCGGVRRPFNIITLKTQTINLDMKDETK